MKGRNRQRLRLPGRKETNPMRVVGPDGDGGLPEESLRQRASGNQEADSGGDGVAALPSHGDVGVPGGEVVSRHSIPNRRRDKNGQGNR